MGILGMGVAGGASAADWRFTPTVGLQEVLTDNVFGTSVKRADAITQLTPGFNLDVEGVRTKLGVNYDPTLSAYLDNSSQDRIDQSLAAAGLVSVVQDRLDVNLNAFASQTSGAGGFVTPAAGGLVPLNQRVLNFGGTLGPHYRERFGDVATLDASYLLSSANSSAAGAARTPHNGLTNSLLQQAEQVILGSGDSFGRLTPQLSLSHTTGTGSGPNNRFSQDRDVVQSQYHITHEYAVTGTLGYDRTHYDRTATSRGFDQAGLTWTVGVLATPNAVTELAVDYGKQQGNYNVDARLTYDLAPRTLITASYVVAVQNQLQSTLQNLQNQSQSPSGAIVDSRTGLPFNPVDQAFGAQNYLSRNKSFNLALTHQFVRSAIVLSVVDTKLQALDGSTQNNETWGTTITYSQELTPKLQGSVDIGYNNTKLGVTTGAAFSFPSGYAHYINADASLAFQINETLSANIRYSFFRRSGVLSQTTNSLLVGLSKGF